jgi:CheY-like chemotaxis protein
VSAKVVVIDDTPHVRAMVVKMLEVDGFTVVGEGGSGAEAILVADQRDPDVIVIDYRMPGMNGLEASRHIRDRHPNQSIILYTAYLDPDLEGRATEAGIALCVDKVEGLNQLERQIIELTREIHRSP